MDVLQYRAEWVGQKVDYEWWETDGSTNCEGLVDDSDDQYPLKPRYLADVAVQEEIVASLVEKRGPGRPRKVPPPVAPPVRRGPGRPRKDVT
ncbi:hypothetical protein BPAE_0258g00070 [Botrytis paeoniae]|uniref:Uncharacterized protein n=1 Tax=Botrytis paeoniae TaxID=278948 RepID=A0A4Z1F950_9HELO|nr:hypothetical protein BPAE_0258g00070 [Botrytis paeoniae]